MSRHLSKIVLFLLLSLTATFTFAQTANTSLRGVVKDPTGALVPGAKINITDKATGLSYSAVANASGEYQFTQIPPAKYDITVTATGFGAQTKTAELLVAQPATINFALSVTTTQEILNVTAEAQTLNTSDAALGGSMDNSTIQALPSETRNVPDLLSLQPGVFYLPTQATGVGILDSRSGAVNGGRSDQGNITVDGIDDNDQVNGFAFTGVLRQTQDSIEEFNVTTGGSNSSDGRSSGAQVSMITKSGTNKFHGAAYEYNRPTFTVANDFFNKQAQLATGQANRPGKLIRNIFGADVGGPIFKDKLFFFANYEGTRQAESAQVTQVVPTALYQSGTLQYLGKGGETVAVTPAQMRMLDAGCQVCNTAAYTPGPGANPNALAYFKLMPASNGLSAGDGLNTGSYSFSSPNPITLNTTIVKFDYLPSAKHRLFVRGNLQKDTTGAVEQFPGQGPSSVHVDNSKGIAGGDTWTISPNMVNDIRYGYVRQGFANSGVGSGDYVDFRFLATATAETRSNITSVPVNNIVDNLNWTKGHHNIQVGGNWRLVYQNNSTNANSFTSGSSNPSGLGGKPIVPNPATIGLDTVNGGFGNSYLQAYANLVGTVAQVTNNYNYAVSSATSGTLLGDGAFISRSFKANEFEWFAQDSWKVKPNLTVTFGIRHTSLEHHGRPRASRSPQPSTRTPGSCNALLPQQKDKSSNQI
jgi:hypothetical protein